MLRFLQYLVIVPVAILFLMFAFANRHWVTVSFDPFESGDEAAFALSAPLFIVIVLSIMIGVIAGGAATWLSQARHRRALRHARAEMEKLRVDLQAAKAAQTSNLPATRRA